MLRRPVLTLAGRPVATVGADESREGATACVAAVLGVHRECLAVVGVCDGQSDAPLTCLLREPEPPTVSLVAPDGIVVGAKLLEDVPPDRSHPDRAMAFLRSLARALAQASRHRRGRRARWSMSVETTPGPVGAWLFVEVVARAGKALTMVSFERPMAGREGAVAQLCLDTCAVEPLDPALVLEENVGLELVQDLAVHPLALQLATTLWLDEYIDGFGAVGCSAAVTARSRNGPSAVDGAWKFAVGRTA